MFERRTDPLLPRQKFYFRVARSLGFGGVVVACSLLVGMVGYHGFEHLSWLDSFLNAAMLLGGEGPIAPLNTPGGKAFAGCYALFCGIAIITTAAVIFSPVVHRAIHRFHLEDEKK